MKKLLFGHKDKPQLAPTPVNQGSSTVLTTPISFPSSTHSPEQQTQTNSSNVSSTAPHSWWNTTVEPECCNALYPEATAKELAAERCSKIKSECGKPENFKTEQNQNVVDYVLRLKDAFMQDAVSFPLAGATTQEMRSLCAVVECFRNELCNAVKEAVPSVCDSHVSVQVFVFCKEIAEFNRLYCEC